MDILRIVRTRKTAQSEQADVRQIPNAAGGYTFSVDGWAQVHRFLTLGTDGGAPHLPRGQAGAQRNGRQPVGAARTRRGLDRRGPQGRAAGAGR